MKDLLKPVPLALLGIFFFLSFHSMLKESVTVDEFYHLPVGYSYLKTGTFHLGNKNPPLGMVLAAAPLLARNVEFTKTPAFHENNHWDYGYDFMFAHPRDYIQLFQDARLIILLIGLLGACFVFFWARDLYGVHAAYGALFLYAFCPNLLAHSHLVTTDVAGSTFLIGALYFVFRWTVRRTWRAALAAGVMLGLAQLMKFTALILYPILLIYFVLWAIDGKSIRARDGGAIAAMIIVSVLTLNAGYLFQGSFEPLRDFQFSSGLLRELFTEIPGWFRFPLPYDYVAGLDLQMKDTESVFFQFLMGRASTEGWWYYYFVAFIFKVPATFLALLLAGIILQGMKKLPRFSSGEYLILLTVVMYFFMMALGRLNLGFRYVLPALPLLYVLISRVTLIQLRPGAKLLAFSIAALLYAAESFSVAPHFLSFFNLLAGGPKNGYRFLVDSNIDWGQDLPALKEYMEQQKMNSIDLAYFGRVDPAIYGIRYRPLGKKTRGKSVAVSVNYYQGCPYYLLTDSRDYLESVPPFYYTYLQKYPIRARIGYSILIVDVP